MAGDAFDYDVIVIGSGFGASVAALRATEKGYRVGVLESGKRWPDEEIPQTSWDIRRFAWQPELEMFGIQRIELLDDVLVLCGAGVGGGSHVYGNTLYVPPKAFLEAHEWAGITDWADELAPYIDQARRMLGVVPGHPGRPLDARPRGRYGRGGPRRTGCINCGNCQLGCGHNAKNKLTMNYLYLAEKHGAKVTSYTRSTRSSPWREAALRCMRHPGWAQRAGHCITTGTRPSR